MEEHARADGIAMNIRNSLQPGWLGGLHWRRTTEPDVFLDFDPVRPDWPPDKKQVMERRRHRCPAAGTSNFDKGCPDALTRPTGFSPS